MPLLELKGVSKCYGKGPGRSRVLEEVSRRQRLPALCRGQVDRPGTNGTISDEGRALVLAELR